MKHILKDLGQEPMPRAYDALYDRARKLDYPLEKPGRSWQSGRAPSNKLAPKDVFVYGRKAPYREGIDILQRCLREIGRFDRCEICGLSEWNGDKIVFDIHHVNADPLDNQEKNLLVVCPNCHRQKEGQEASPVASA